MKPLISFFAIFNFIVCFGQKNKTIQIVDLRTLEPLISAYINNLNTNSTTFSNEKGYFTIEASNTDTIIIRLIGYEPKTLFINEATNTIYLQSIQNYLSTVTISDINYKKDSLERRLEYGKAFNYKNPSFKKVMTGMVSSPVTTLYNLMSFKKNTRKNTFRNQLISDEQNDFVDGKFNKDIVKKLTKLAGDSLELFMKRFKPSYNTLILLSDYEFYKYINDSFTTFKNPNPIKE